MSSRTNGRLVVDGRGGVRVGGAVERAGDVGRQRGEQPVPVRGQLARLSTQLEVRPVAASVSMLRTSTWASWSRPMPRRPCRHESTVAGINAVEPARAHDRVRGAAGPDEPLGAALRLQQLPTLLFGSSGRAT